MCWEGRQCPTLWLWPSCVDWGVESELPSSTDWRSCSAMSCSSRAMTLLCQDAALLFYCSMAVVCSRQLLLALSDDSEVRTGGGQVQVCPVNREMQWLLVRAAAGLRGSKRFTRCRCSRHAEEANKRRLMRKKYEMQEGEQRVGCWPMDETATGLPRAESRRKRCETCSACNTRRLRLQKRAGCQQN